MEDGAGGYPCFAHISPSYVKSKIGVLMKKYLLFLFVLFIFIKCTSIKSSSEVKTGQHPQYFEKEIIRSVKANYLLYLPKDYNTSEKKWPLILYLHGNMGRGDDLKKISWYPVPKMLSQNDSIPFIVVSPQCPLNDTWTDTDLLISLLDDVISKYSVDTSRVYLTGYSMGGSGVWNLASKYPERFAAIAPMSGFANPILAPRLKNLPIWLFYNTKVKNNYTVPSIEKMIQVIKDEGGNIKVTLHPERDHCPPSLSEHMSLFDWFMEHQIK